MGVFGRLSVQVPPMTKGRQNHIRVWIIFHKCTPVAPAKMTANTTAAAMLGT